MFSPFLHCPVSIYLISNCDFRAFSCHSERALQVVFAFHFIFVSVDSNESDDFFQRIFRLSIQYDHYSLHYISFHHIQVWIFQIPPNPHGMAEEKRGDVTFGQHDPQHTPRTSPHRRPLTNSFRSWPSHDPALASTWAEGAFIRVLIVELSGRTVGQATITYIKALEGGGRVKTLNL